jgi:hypothetical protein
MVGEPFSTTFVVIFSTGWMLVLAPRTITITIRHQKVDERVG